MKTIKSQLTHVRRVNDAAIIINRSVVAQLRKKLQLSPRSNQNAVIHKYKDVIARSLDQSVSLIVDHQLDNLVDLIVQERIDRLIQQTMKDALSLVLDSVSDHLINDEVDNIQKFITETHIQRTQRPIDSMAESVVQTAWSSLINSIFDEDILEQVYNTHLRYLFERRKLSTERSIRVNNAALKLFGQIESKVLDVVSEDVFETAITCISETIHRGKAMDHVALSANKGAVDCICEDLIASAAEEISSEDYKKRRDDYIDDISTQVESFIRNAAIEIEFADAINQLLSERSVSSMNQSVASYSTNRPQGSELLNGILSPEASIMNSIHESSFYQDDSMQSSMIDQGHELNDSILSEQSHLEASVEASLASKEPDRIINDLAVDMNSKSLSLGPSASVSLQPSAILASLTKIFADDSEEESKGSESTLDASIQQADSNQYVNGEEEVRDDRLLQDIHEIASDFVNSLVNSIMTSKTHPLEADPAETSILDVSKGSSSDSISHIDGIYRIMTLYEDGLFYESYDALVLDYSSSLLIVDEQQEVKDVSNLPGIIHVIITMLYGQIFMATGHYSDAHIYFNHALAIMDKIPDTAGNILRNDVLLIQMIIHMNIGMIWRLLAKYEEANASNALAAKSMKTWTNEADYRQSGADFESLDGSVVYHNGEDYAVLPINSSSPSASQEVPLIDKTATFSEIIMTTVLSKRSLESYYIQIMTEKGYIEYDEGRYSDCIMTLQRIRFYLSRIDHEVLPSQCLQSAITSYFSLCAMIYELFGHYSKARIVLKTVLSMRESLLGSNHSLVYRTMNDLGRVSLLYGLPLDAREYIKQAYEQRQLSILSDATINAKDVQTVTDVEALVLSDQLANVHMPSIAPDEYHPEIAESLHTFGLFYFDIGDLSEAYKYFEKSSIIREKIYAPDHPLVAESFHSLGQYFLTLGLLNKSQIFFNCAKDILISKKYPDHHLMVLSLKRAAAMVFESEGQFAEAKEVYISLISTYENLSCSLNVKEIAWWSQCRLGLADMSLQLGLVKEVQRLSDFGIDNVLQSRTFGQHHSTAIKRQRVSCCIFRDDLIEL